VRCVKVDRRLWCDAVVPDELVLLVELQVGRGGKEAKEAGEGAADDEYG
jgi:hypothetical protein